MTDPDRTPGPPPPIVLAVSGAAGRTGRLVVEGALARGHHVIAITRRATEFAPHERLEQRVADALDAHAFVDALAGVDAVISTLGPSPDAPPDLSSRNGALLLEAMGVHAIAHAVVVTGAMTGTDAELGRFYRLLARIPASRRLLDDRRALERTLRESQRPITIVRPPRLTDAVPSRHGVEIDERIVVRMLDSIARADLARVLVELAESAPPTASRTVVVRARRRALRHS